MPDARDTHSSQAILDAGDADIEDGLTMDMPTARGIQDLPISNAAEAGIEDGFTIAMPNARDTYSSQAVPDAGDADIEDGFTVTMPTARDTYSSQDVPDASDGDIEDGFTVSMPAARDTLPISDAVEADIEDGFTVAMPAARDTLPISDAVEADIEDGFTVAMPAARDTQDRLSVPDAGDADIEDGFTMAMPNARDTQDNLSVPDISNADTVEEDLTVAMTPAKDTEPQADLTTVKPNIKDITRVDGTEEFATDHVKRAPKTRVITSEITLNLGEVLQDRYRLDKLLGRGGYGAAYLAQDIRLKRICVVKQMLHKQGVSARQLEEQRASFEKEASLLVQLNQPGHPNIPEIYDYFYDDTGNYLVMKYIEGQNLKEVIDQNEGKIPWRKAIRYIIDVSSALNYMHTQGQEPVMHRDIKPANILLGNDNRIWLIDFGLAKEDPLEKSTKQIDNRAAGSVGYAPLEQWFGEAAPASDIYAVGATLHHMVTGLNPIRAFSGKFDIQKIHELHGKFTPIREVDRRLPKNLEEIITGATAAKPAERPTAQQLQEQLQVVITGAQGAALFTFKNGRSARTVEELVDLCDKNKKEAQEHLCNGNFERWFLLINRNDLASAATQAMQQSKTKREGLEIFLKLILPNLFVRRLTRFGGQTARLGALIILIFLVAVAVLAAGSSYIIGQIVEQTIDDGVVWTFSTVDLAQKQVYDETYLHEKFNAIAGTYFDDDIQVDVNAPDQINVSATWSGFPLNVAFSVRLAHNQPRIYISTINSIPLYLITNNISRGINNGIQAAFRRSPVDISSLIVRDDKVVFTIEEARTIANASSRPTLTLPTPTYTPLPPTPTPTVTPTPVKFSLVVIFNDLSEDVDIHIKGRTVEGGVWATVLPIIANRAEVIEPPAGAYSYTVTYKSDGEWAAEGSEEWVLKQAYRVRIVPEPPTLTPTPTATPGAESDQSK